MRITITKKWYQGMSEMYQILMSPIEIFAPFVIILRSDQLKIHSIRMIKNIYDDALMLSIYLVPVFLFIAVNLIVYIISKVLNVWDVIYVNRKMQNKLGNQLSYFKIIRLSIYREQTYTHFIG